MTRGLRWLVHQAVITQRSSRVLLVDVILAQCVWGRRSYWPPNWRQRLLLWFSGGRPLGSEPPIKNVFSACSGSCPLFGRNDIPHQHFWYRLEDPLKFLGCLQVFAKDEELDHSFLYDFRQGTDLIDPDTGFELVGLMDLNSGKDPREDIPKLRKRGRLAAVYLPALLLGPSPRSGLSPSQRNILIALTHELTRARSSTREDKAEVFLAGRNDPEAEPGGSTCPFLPPGTPVVGFNGNGSRRRQHFHGRGYRFVGRTGGGWLPRAGFEWFVDPLEIRSIILRFLRDLEHLSEPFGLIVAGWHPRSGQWRTLAEMATMTGSPAGQRWLSRCLLRVYTGADYLDRWRRHFARQMGFATIPGDRQAAETVVPRQDPGAAITSAVDLDLWMKRTGRTDQQLATELQKSRSYVSRMRSGRRRWSPPFQALVMAVYEKEENRNKVGSDEPGSQAHF